MFQLTADEAAALRSQSVILEKGRGRHSKYAPLAFTEHGVAMLSSVLNSARAPQMNILIIRAFVKLREWIAARQDLARKIEEMERTQKKQGQQIAAILQHLIDIPKRPKRPIGFQPLRMKDEDRARQKHSGLRDGLNGTGMRDRALEVLRRLPPAPIVLPVQTLGELFHVLVRQAGRAPSHARVAVLGWQDAFCRVHVARRDDGQPICSHTRSDIGGTASGRDGALKCAAG